jgi:hypothetical protein
LGGLVCSFLLWVCLSSNALHYMGAALQQWERGYPPRAMAYQKFTTHSLFNVFYSFLYGSVRSRRSGDGNRAGGYG